MNEAKVLIWVGSSLKDLRSFQKKAKRGIATPQQDITLIRARLKQAEEIQARRQAKGEKK
jgi:phage-related protein